MPRHRGWEQEMEDDMAVKKEVSEAKAKEEGFEDYEDQWDEWDEDYEDECDHGSPEGYCDVTCTACKHQCSDHAFYSRSCHLCDCQHFDERTTLDHMAQSVNEVPDNVNKKD